MQSRFETGMFRQLTWTKISLSADGNDSFLFKTNL
jgi:hypothetical protein